jgi:hypothetical protein
MRSMSGAKWPSRRPSWIAQASVYRLGANTLIHPNAWRDCLKNHLLTSGAQILIACHCKTGLYHGSF